MKTFTHTVDGDTVTVHFPEVPADIGGFFDFLARGDKVLGLDTETTGLDLYSVFFKCRLIQFGNDTEAWVLRTDLFADAARRALRQDRRFVVHNAAYDLQVIDRSLGVRIEELGPRVFDTRIFAHLLDPRQRHEGGAGLSLKELCEVFVDPTAPDTAEGLTKVFNSEYKTTKAKGWAVIDIDHPTYVTYAGLDPVLALRLFRQLAPMIRDLGLDHLSQFEHHFQLLLSIMQRKGMKVDVAYTEHLRDELLEEAANFKAVAKRYGVENVNSTKQVGEALVGMGESLRERTGSGSPKVDKGVLLPLADLDNNWNRIEARTPNPLADAVVRAKRAEKWSASYAQAFLDLRDESDRLHPFIGGLQARTARMSVSRPPLQQLPSGDWKVRRALVADEGFLIVSADYAQVELRILAALANEEAMKKAIREGIDLHDYTASLVYGDGFTKSQRKLMKGVGFGKVYGGGATTLARQTGAPLEQVKHAIAEYDRVYPGVSRFSRTLQRRAEFGKKEVVTVTGRHLPLDRDRLYAATNYVCQSTSRDVTAQAIVDLFDAGYGDYLLMPVHDEVVAQAPTAEADEFAQEMARIMTVDNFYGVPLTAEGETYGRSWGHGYGATE